MNGVERITAERQRQIEVEGWTSGHDAEHGEGQLAIAAACYALPEPDRIEETMPYFAGTGIPKLWPWDRKWWKPTPANRIRELEKAGALIAAEIDRLLVVAAISSGITAEDQ